MIHISKKTAKSRRTLKKQIDRYFGKNGLGLHPVAPRCACACFEGGGGYVIVDILDQQNSRIIDIQSREWEYAAERFMRMI